jgi:hypothetical protein
MALEVVPIERCGKDRWMEWVMVFCWLVSYTAIFMLLADIS